nr:hypothetical protein [Saccharopolyspora pogona]
MPELLGWETDCVFDVDTFKLGTGAHFGAFHYGASEIGLLEGCAVEFGAFEIATGEVDADAVCAR